MYNGKDIDRGSFSEIDLILASPPGYLVFICCTKDSTFSFSFSWDMPVCPMSSVDVWPSLSLSITVRRPVFISFFKSVSFWIRTGTSMLCFLKNIFPRMWETWLRTLVSTMMKSCCVSSLLCNSYWSNSTFNCRIGKTVFTYKEKVKQDKIIVKWVLKFYKYYCDYLSNTRFLQQFLPVINCGLMVNFFAFFQVRCNKTNLTCWGNCAMRQNTEMMIVMVRSNSK